MRRAAVLLLLLLVPEGPGADGSPAFPDRIRGITVSTHTDGRDWAFDEMAPTLAELKRLGAEWVAIHPYAGVRRNGEVRFRPIDPQHPPEHVVRPIREAHALGLKILIKPHLAYWGSFEWRGTIEFSADQEWQRFWDGYERWIVALAGISREADGFVVGTELDRTVAHEQRWRRIVARVREQTAAPLTYAANWDSFEQVPFWDAVDAIGIQAYFPLIEEQQPTAEAAIRAGWDRLAARLTDFAARKRRPILFTELGYNHSFEAAFRPWDHGTDGDAARPLARTCMRVALQTIEREPALAGAFLWKWFPQPHPVGRNFQLATPGMQAVIRESWARRADEAPRTSAD